MKNNKILFTKVRASLGVVATCLTLLILGQPVTAQDFLSETFSEEILITPVFESHIFGEELDGDVDRVRWDYIKDIAPGTGQWFCGTRNGEPAYKWDPTGGENGDGAIVMNYTGGGSANMFYIFNNKNGRAASFVFDAIFRYETGTSNGGAISYYNIPEQIPADNSTMNWRTYNGGTGGFSDNGSIRFKGNSNDFGTWWSPNLSGEIPGWRTFGGEGITMITSGEFTGSFTGVGGEDWIVIGFAFVKGSPNPDASELIGLDFVTLPFGNADEVAPVVSLNRSKQDTLGVFPTEIGKTYFVPAGTTLTEADLVAASLVPVELAYPVTGSFVSLVGIADGKYDLHVVDAVGNISLGNQVNIGADIYAPLLSTDVTSVFAGFDNVIGTMDEAGTLKLVADGAGPDASAVLSASAVEKTPTTLVFAETVAAADYDLYAIDAAGNASVAIDITVEAPDVIAPVFSNVGKTELIATDSIEFTTDQPTLWVYVTPDTTVVSDLPSLQAVAMDSLFLDGGTMGAIPAVNLPQGFYILYSTDRFGNVGTSGDVYELVDVVGPIAFEVDGGVVEKGFPISLVINEIGVVYVVPQGTATTDLVTAAVASDSAQANSILAISTLPAGFVKGNFYDIYAVDLRNNVSDLLSTIQIKEDEAAIVLANEVAVAISIYPNPAADIINVEAEDIQSLELLDMGGKRVLSSTKNYLEIGDVENGIYILRVQSKSGLHTSKIAIQQ